MNEFIRTAEYGYGYVNKNHVIDVFIDDAYENGRKLEWKFAVKAKLTYGSCILFQGSEEQCRNYLDKQFGGKEIR